MAEFEVVVAEGGITPKWLSATVGDTLYLKGSIDLTRDVSLIVEGGGALSTSGGTVSRITVSSGVTHGPYTLPLQREVLSICDEGGGGGVDIDIKNPN